MTHVLIVLVAVLALTGEQTRKPNPPRAPTNVRVVETQAQEWKVEDLRSEELLKIFERPYYSIPGCSVFVLKDRKGLQLNASEQRGDTSSNTVIYINGRRQSPHVFSEKKMKNGMFIPPLEGQKSHPNIFVRNCIEPAKRLPPDVRKLFFGYGGIQ
ncbi:MAG TPA: hypothetical protein VF974_00295 [Patescibacteria group bacterium]